MTQEICNKIFAYILILEYDQLNAPCVEQSFLSKETTQWTYRSKVPRTQETVP